MRHLLTLSLLLATTAGAAGDPKLGKPLHDQQCVSCHVKQMGVDGSKIYTRSPRLVNDKKALRERVGICAKNTAAGWHPEEEEHVTAYLNQQYYKFK